MESETNPALHWRNLIFSAGLVFFAVGGRPLVNYLSGDSSLKSIVPSLLLSFLGIALVGIAFFYKPKPENKLFQKLGVWAASPAPYVVLALLFWIYFETLAIQRNIEIAALPAV